MRSTPVALVLCAMASAARPADAAPGLLAGYGFSEGSGTSTTDASGNGITGTLVSGPAWVAGKEGTGGLSFNGSSTYVDLGNPPALQLTGSMTLSAWVLETANVGDDGQIVAKSDGGAGWQLKSSPDTGVRTFAMRIVSSTGAIVQRYSRTVRSLNTWYHVTGVYDAAARTLNIYLNGELDNGVLAGTVGTSQRNATVNANLGRRTGGFYIRGTMDDVRVYGRALTPTEILDDMNNPVAAPPSDTTPPSTPADLAALAASSTQIDLGWTASTDDVGVAGYEVFRNGARIATTANSFYSDTGLSPATTYSYSVSAFDAAANDSALSIPVSATTDPAPGDTAPPSTPVNLVAAAVSSSQINLSWRASTDDVAVTGYTVFRNGTPVGTPASPSFQDTGLSASTTYAYAVSARDAAGNVSQLSAPASATTNSAGGSSGVFQNEILVSGLSLPTAIKFLPGGDMLVLELGGTIRRVHFGTWQVAAPPFLVLTNIGTLNGQQGLMDLAFDPGFATNHFYYLFYTLGSPNRDRASRFTANADLTGTLAGSEMVIYQDPNDANAEHHGGSLNFGNDGKLYVTTGDHFDADGSQSLSSPRGKVLRFNPDGTVPADNPFFDGAGPNFDAIWALGLRNPFRAFYDSPTGRYYIADVGGNDPSTAREEVDLGIRGANYGWPTCEGFACASNPAFTSPLFAYPHNGRDASITGGFIYRGTQFPPDHRGNYFYADYAQNWIKRLTLDAAGNVTGSFNFEPPDGTPDGPLGDVVYLAQGPDDALYYVDLGFSDTTGQSGISKIRRIRFISSNQPPAVVASAQPTSGPAPLTVGFSTAGTLDPEGDPLGYAWDFGDSTTSTEANPVHSYATSGPYSARVAVSDGNSTTLSAPIAISVGSRPTPVISSPTDGVLFRAGDTIAFSGDASDAEDGPLPASAFTWNIDFLHEGHVHPGLPQTGVKSGTFVIPTSGHDFSGFTRYRITLTVVDSDGLQGSQSVVIFPDKVSLSFDSVANGLLLNLDGIPFAVPFIHDTLIGFQHAIEAPDQTLGQNSYSFVSWSDGGAKRHTIVVPAADASYVATYQMVQNPLPAGLVAGYRFSEGAGLTTADLSGNGISGTLQNGVAWVPGQYGGGLGFSGDSYVNLGDPAALRFTGSMTVSAWIKISANPGDDGAIVAKLGPAGWQLKTSPDTGARTAALQISSNGSDSIQRYSRTVLAANTWYHLAGVYDVTARTLSVYVNGARDDGELSGSVPASQFNAPFAVNIGQRTGEPGNFNFLGTIDEVHLYGRVLTAAEIQVDMTTPR